MATLLGFKSQTPSFVFPNVYGLNSSFQSFTIKVLSTDFNQVSLSFNVFMHAFIAQNFTFVVVTEKTEISGPLLHIVTLPE